MSVFTSLSVCACAKVDVCVCVCAVGVLACVHLFCAHPLGADANDYYYFFFDGQIGSTI